MTVTEVRAPRRRFGEAGERLLDVRGLQTSFHTRDGVVRAVTGVDFHVDRGEVMGLVGESGCGKSVTSLSIMRLIVPPGRIDAGEVVFDGVDLLGLRDRDMRNMRGERISMIFQQPTSSLNPVYDVGMQVGEMLELHRQMKRKDARDRALELLQMVGIPDPKRRLEAFPHELSGGMAQRVMIAMALACEPELLIADEPTTALDVTIQAQILEVMRDLRQKNRMAIMLITHDLGVVAEMADEVVVMYAGKVVERGDVKTIFGSPHHPYTQGLLHSIPRLDERVDRLEVIKGTVPSPYNLPTGCLFKRRCPFRMPICDTAPPYRQLSDDHFSRCWLTPEGAPPDVGADAPPEEAEAAGEQLTVEAR
jgi:peptide/nickel transport system ATP-binding protein